jgi:hypothetical protein
VLTYFRNQVHRMDYPRYLAHGWQIGSGPVESACKTVVGQRLKGAGMRWARTARTPSVTSAPSSAASLLSGRLSGTTIELRAAYKQDADPRAPRPPCRGPAG